MKIAGKLEQFTDTREQNSSAMITSQGNTVSPGNRDVIFCGQLGNFCHACPKRIEQGTGKPPHKAKTVEETTVTEECTLVSIELNSVGEFAISVGSNSHQMGNG